jgi:hypothetical protein
VVNTAAGEREEHLVESRLSDCERREPDPGAPQMREKSRSLVDVA